MARLEVDQLLLWPRKQGLDAAVLGSPLRFLVIKKTLTFLSSKRKKASCEEVFEPIFFSRVGNTEEKKGRR